MTYVLSGCQLFLAGVLLLSAIGKVLSPQQFMKALRATSLPQSLLLPLALSVLVAEFGLAIGLIFTWSLLLVWIGVLCLLGVFTGWITWMYARKISLHCGCFGQARSAIGRGNIIRNLVFLGVAVLGLFLTWQQTASLLPSPPFWVLLPVLVIIGCLLLLMTRRLYLSSERRKMTSSSQIA